MTCTASVTLQAQFLLKLSGGWSAGNEKTIVQSDGLYGATLGANWRYGKKWIGIAEFGMTAHQISNPYQNRMSSRFFGFGIGYDLLNQPKKLFVTFVPQIGGFTLVPNEKNPFGTTHSRWSQQGFRMEGYYYFNQWLGCYLAYSRFFSNRRGDSDYQAFIEAGVCLRVMRRKETAEQPKQE